MHAYGRNKGFKRKGGGGNNSNRPFAPEPNVFGPLEPEALQKSREPEQLLRSKEPEPLKIFGGSGFDSLKINHESF